MIRIITPLIILSFSLLTAQAPMDKGFNHLEKGEFKEAKTFFENYLATNPPNKTAQLCFGRALGLSGEPEKATEHFEKMLVEYSDDYEILSNHAESFLWAKNFKGAKPHYITLVEKFPDKFGALLGFANTLSNLQEYVDALKWVNQAIALEPDNEGAKISRKYIKMGYANEFVKKEEYKTAENLLKQIFNDFPEDKNVLQILANIYLMTKEFDKKIDAYERMATSFKDSIVALNGIALAHHLDGKSKKALHFAELAKAKVDTQPGHEMTNDTYNRYVQALIWNHKYVPAKKKIDSLEIKHPNSNWVLSLRSTLGMYTADFKTSIKNYNSILANDSTSFDGNLGKANALFASDELIPAYEGAFQTLRIFGQQRDAIGFIERLNIQNSPSAEQWFQYTFDNGDNIAYAATTTINVPFSPSLKSTFKYQYRTSENEVTVNQANSHTFSGAMTFKIRPKVYLQAEGGVFSAQFLDTTYLQPTLNLKLQTKPFRLNSLDLYYIREMQAFNAELIKREIVMNNYGLTYNLGTNFNLGWYTQLIYTPQTDGNTRNLLFTSLYYNLARKPAFKIGLNFSYITFAEQVPTIYFSPSIYRNAEFFFDLRGNFSSKTKGFVSAAGGLQKVEDDDETLIYRAETGLTHEFSKRLKLDVYGKYSNIASAIGAGFQFTEFGLKLNWNITKQPLFFKSMFSEEMSLLETTDEEE
ncbi:tetratricopeptide repeat protein [Croceivirga thetidis]|uniref:Tetratricopeptide repeat protein n=1 Tax=Croceivirga thetidis TaxID=2721623 RepID=A0ABX1GNQ0_9FLAO|nr:hypothetical protein [Croceivirga thetidis]NKI30716.1 hypothetical protein [Croceivirga thetidis]